MQQQQINHIRNATLALRFFSTALRGSQYVVLFFGVIANLSYCLPIFYLTLQPLYFGYGFLSSLCLAFQTIPRWDLKTLPSLDPLENI